MAVYFAAYSVLMLVAVFTMHRTKNKSTQKNICIMCFMVIFLLLALRHQFMGVDLAYRYAYGYLGSFDILSSLSWKQIITMNGYMNYEKGFVVLNKLIGSIFHNRQFYLAVCAFLSIFPISYTISKKSDESFLSHMVYMGLPIFGLLFSGLRQSLALAICFFSLKFIQEKKLAKFILVVFLATLFHKTAFIFIIAYPVYHLKLRKPTKLLSVLLLPIVYLLRYPLFSILSKLLRDNAVPDNNGALTLFVVFSLIYLFVILVGKDSESQNGYSNLFYIACLCQAFGGVYSTAMRVGYYFMAFLVLLLPNVILEIEDKRQKTLFYLAVLMCFVAYGLFSLSQGGWAMTNPYIPFWKAV